MSDVRRLTPRSVAHRRAAARRRGALEGFSLLEVSIALLLIGGIMGMVVTSMSALSGAKMRKLSGQMQGVFRDTYARTALSGNSHRVVFTIPAVHENGSQEPSTWWIERTQGGVVMQREKFTFDKDGFAKLAPSDARLDGLDEQSDDIKDKTKLDLFRPMAWSPVDGEFGKPQKLNSSIYFHKIWVEHLEGYAEKGQVAVHFFPGGYVEEAHIYISDSVEVRGKDALIVVTHPLTGETSIADEPPPLPF